MTVAEAVARLERATDEMKAAFADVNRLWRQRDPAPITREERMAINRAGNRARRVATTSGTES